MIESFRALFAPPRHFLLLVAAMWMGLALAEKRSERYGISKDQLNSIAFYGLFGYIVGGRVLFVLSHFSVFVQSPLGIFSPNPDLFDPTSGLVTAVLVAFIYGRRQKLQLWQTLDALTPLFATLAIGLSLSHLAAGTAFGSPTTLPWGIDLWNAIRHPTQIYELLASLLILGLIWFRKTDSPPGILFLHFAALTAGSRLFIEAFHGDSTLILEGFRSAQIAAWTTLAVVLFISETLKQKNIVGNKTH
jgi:phosphatidylglycerol:prolipoprotein diacylglycerol transferase